MRDVNTRLVSSPSIAPAANRTATANGVAVDLANYDGCLAVINFGVITDGGWTPKLQESDDNSTFTDVAAADQVGTFTEAGSASDETTQQAAYIGTKRYVRVVVTESSASSTGALFSAALIRTNPRKP